MILVGGSVASAVTNLLVNPTFEGTGSGSLTGWKPNAATLSLVAGDGGGYAARMTATGTGGDYVQPTNRTVIGVAKGVTYTGGARISSVKSGQTVCFQIKEVPSGGGNTVGSANHCMTVTATWQSFKATTYTTQTAGDDLTIRISQTSTTAGASFDIDNLSLTSGSGGGGGGDTTAPSVPAGVTATGQSSSSIQVGWSASTDNTAVTGYHVYRNGNLVTTTSGTGTGYLDTGLAASTTYSYTVDAFDAAGNTSAQSTAATGTTSSGGGGGGSGVPCGLLPASTAPYQHVVVLMEENLTYSDFVSLTNTPEMHALAAGCRNETNAAGETHPSFPNYEAVTSGQFSTCLGCNTSADNIFHQMNGSGGALTWRDYNQSMPANCAVNTNSVSYYRDGHNPAFWYTDLGSSGDNTCSKYDIPLDPYFWNDVAADNLPSFTWIAPDDCRDGHWMSGVCENVVPGKTKNDRMAVADDFVKQVLTAIAATPSYQAGQTLFVLTFDESNYQSTEAGGHWGIDCSNQTVFAANKQTCQVGTVLVSARLPAGQITAFQSLYGLGAAIEQNFGLPLLGAESKVTPAPIY